MEKLKELNELKHDLVDAVKMEVAKGLESIDTEEMGAVVDMIKDLASAEKNCMEACYYESVIEAMGDSDNERAGYDRWRYASGRFAPKGRGKYGYMPPETGDRTMPVNNPNIRYGYTPNERMGHDMKPSERLDDAMDMMGDIWTDSDVETRKKMKNLVRDLLDQMEQNI